MLDVAYHEVRTQIRSGDLLLKRAGWQPSRKAIAAAGRSPYCHAAMAVWTHDVLLCVEMDFSGGRAVTLSSRVERSPGRWDVFAADPAGQFKLDRYAAAAAMLRLAGTAYGWRKLFYLGLRRLPVLRWVLKTPGDDQAIDGAPLICSEACSFAYRAGGCDPCANLADSHTEPGDLARSNLFAYRFTLLGP